jgi:hypothetical protein
MSTKADNCCEEHCQHHELSCQKAAANQPLMQMVLMNMMYNYGNSGNTFHLPIVSSNTVTFSIQISQLKPLSQPTFTVYHYWTMTTTRRIQKYSHFHPENRYLK